MYRRRSSLFAVLAAFLVFGTELQSAGCSTDPPPLRWREVTSGSFTGTETQRLDLGTFYLSGRPRIAWDLSGPSDARAVFRLSVSRSTDASTTETRSASLRSWQSNFAPQSDADFAMRVEPDYYRVTLTQRLPRGASTGYAGNFTLYTQDLD